MSVVDGWKDDELLDRVHEAVRITDPPPVRLRDAAMRALTWDHELEAMQLLYDSAAEPVGVMRGAAAVTARDLTFGDEELSVEISITEDEGGATTLDGMISDNTMGDRVIDDPTVGVEVADGSAGDVDVVIVQPNRPKRQVPVDEHGRFLVTVEGMVAGIVIVRPEGRRLATGIFSLDLDAG